MRILKIYQCEICNECHNNYDDAEKCENRGIQKVDYKVGDIVEYRYGFGWYDGDKRWIINPNVKLKVNGAKCPNKDSNCFDKCCSYGFYYVISAIDKDPEQGHRTLVHLFTNAMSGKQGYKNGWTSIQGHYTPRIIKNPPKFIIKDSKSLLGLKSKYLI